MGALLHHAGTLQRCAILPMHIRLQMLSRTTALSLLSIPHNSLLIALRNSMVRPKGSTPGLSKPPYPTPRTPLTRLANLAPPESRHPQKLQIRPVGEKRHHLRPASHCHEHPPRRRARAQTQSPGNRSRSHRTTGGRPPSLLPRRLPERRPLAQPASYKGKTTDVSDQNARSIAYASAMVAAFPCTLPRNSPRDSGPPRFQAHQSRQGPHIRPPPPGPMPRLQRAQPIVQYSQPRASLD